MASITELKAACKRKDLTLIKTIIDQTPNLIREMVYDSEGNTLLMKSCLEGWDEIVKYLMSKYFSFIDINQRNEEGKSALYHAASKGNVDCVRELLSHPDIDVNLQSREGKFALFQAASKGKGDCIRELLSHPNINVNLQSKEGKSALFRAASKGNTDCVRKLLSHPNINVNLQYGEWNKPVLWYCKNRECFELLLHYYPEMKEHERTMAWIWAMYNTSERGFKKVKEFMEKFSKDKLYQMGDDISMLVFIAAEKGDKDMLEYLLSSYGDVIDINIQNKDGRTPLDQATSYERRDCIDILRNLKDIDGTIRDKDGKTAREMELFVRQGDSSIEIKIKEMDFLSKQKFVRWNRSKIMLVGQGRAGKTALANNLAGIWIGDTESTIGAEMEMRVLYGGVKGGRLEKYESPMDVTEALLAEGLYSENQNNRIRTRNPETSSKSPLMDSPQVESHESQKKEMSLIVSLKPSDIKSEKVEIYYRQLWEVDTASNYKLLLVDFGGQSLFNILHGFFMSRYGIYLVVFDMELFLSSDAAGRESCRKELRFWLNSITMHTFDGSKGTAAPVAIVGTRGDKISNEEIYQNISLELKNMFGDMMIWKSLILNEDLSFFPNNNTLTENNPVSARLLRFIETSLENEDYLQRDTPILWIKIFDEMRSLKQSYLSYEEVIRISRERYQDVRESLIENEEDVEEVDRQILTEVRKMLRFLNDMGMLMWIEEKGLEDVIILDPMEYLVKPATIIICKHLATKDDPYGTIHHIAEIHGESKKVYSFDWEMMLEYGIVSEKLARDLLLRYYNYQVRSERAVDPDLADKLLLFMIKFGLMIPSFSSSISSASDIRKSYLAPSLLPCAPSILEFNRQDRKIESMLSRMQRRYDQMSESWKNIGLYFSLFCFLPQDGLSAAKSFGAYGVMSSSELSQQGFLPHSLFERMICRLIQSMCGHDTNLTMEERLVDNDLIIGFRGKVQLSYQDCEIRIIERQEENRIEVIGQSRDKDKDKEQKVFIEIYEACLDKMNQSIDECYKGLQVEPLIHLPQSSLTSTSSKEEGFITRDKVMKLLSSSDATEFKGNSADMNCVPDPLIAGAMKRNPYWSVWKKKDQTTQTPAAPPLRAEKNTHVFLSHDWGIDRSNHQRVKQISDALKSRGLVTWIDDEWIVNDIDRKIIDGIDHTECMIVFLTENYVSKVDGGNHKDYCKREFNYGFEKFGKDKILVVVLDESLKDSSKWGSTIPFNLGSVLYVDMTETSSSNNSINDLYQRILKIVYPERMVVESKTPVNDGSDTVVKS